MEKPGALIEGSNDGVELMCIDEENKEDEKKSDQSVHDMKMDESGYEGIRNIQEQVETQVVGKEMTMECEDGAGNKVGLEDKTEKNEGSILPYPVVLYDEEPQIVQGNREGAEDLLETVVHSEEEAYKLYCNYAHTIGFSVRKGKQYYHIGTKKIRSKEYCCSKEGLNDREKLTEKNWNDTSSRTNCKAMVRFKANEDGEWRVSLFVGDHNHKLLAEPGKRHLLRSNRNHITKKEIESILATKYMLRDPVTTHANFGDTSKHNFSPLLTLPKLPIIDVEDSQSLVKHFKRRANEDSMFYWDVQVDQAGRMTNFFWRDGRSRLDYSCFGDVVVFDSTYRTNKYNIICAPFVGVNHHWQNVMFGCAFLLDESLESLLWLFKSFKQSMGCRDPKSIFTNQDQDLAKAIEEFFPVTHHRIAQWHIQKSAATRLGILNTSKAFNKIFTKCLRGCETESVFEETWAKMLDEFKLQDNNWINKLYKLRHKWCTALNKDTFDGGIELQPQCDCMSNMFKGIADKSSSLSSVILVVEKLIADWREKELDEDVRCFQKAPCCVIKYSDILNYAAKVYTHRVYKLFETEFLDGCGATLFKQISCCDTSYTFEMTTQGKFSEASTVFLDISTLELRCSCSKFEMMGLLCSHALKALMVKNVTTIPPTYILKRWTKDAKKGIHNLIQYESLSPDGSDVAFCQQAMEFAYDLVLKSQGQEESRKILWDALENGEKALDRLFDFSSFQSHAFLPSL